MGNAKKLEIVRKQYKLSQGLTISTDDSQATNPLYKQGKAYIRLDLTFQGAATDSDALVRLMFSLENRLKKKYVASGVLAETATLNLIPVPYSFSRHPTVQSKRESIGKRTFLLVVDGNKDEAHIDVYLPLSPYVAPTQQHNAHAHSALASALAELKAEDIIRDRDIAHPSLATKERPSSSILPWRIL